MIDTDSSGTITWAEVRFFLENVRQVQFINWCLYILLSNMLLPRSHNAIFLSQSDINPDARKIVLEASHDHELRFPEFQAWLIKATRVDPGLKNTFASENYNKSLGKLHDESITHSWNKHTMSQNLRRMQYAVRGEIVIRADACEQ